jgi:H+/Cl- antiporter ClcA
MKITKISIILMIIGGVPGLALCFFDAMISYADTADADYNGFKLYIPQYSAFIIRAVLITLGGILTGWLMSLIVNFLRSKKDFKSHGQQMPVPQKALPK